MKHKVINLKKDKVFKHSVVYNDSLNYTEKMRGKYEPRINPDEREIPDSICDLVIQRKLDRTDLKILEARDCSPMPSLREVARQLKMNPMLISRRVLRIKRLLTIAISL